MQHDELTQAWIWQQRYSGIGSGEMALAAAAYPGPRAYFRSVPQVVDTVGDRLAIEDIMAASQYRWVNRHRPVVVLQVAADLLAWLAPRQGSGEAAGLLVGLRAFPDLTMVVIGEDLGVAIDALTPLLPGVRVIPLSIPDAPDDDLLRWQEACALLPATVSLAQALRLGQALNLDVAPGLWPRLDPSHDGKVAAAIQWNPGVRAAHLDRLRLATSYDQGRELPGRIIGPLTFWRTMLRVLPLEPNSYSRLTLDLLLLWDDPEGAAEALAAYVGWPEAGRLARELGACVAADRQVDGLAIVLPWTAAAHPEAYAALEKLGLGARVGTP